MLLRLKVKNFLSFYEETTFDMFPNLKRTTFQNHIYQDMEIPLLKQAAIYGANGSGKSNLLDTIKLIKFFAIEKDYLKKVNIPLNKFQLAGNMNNAPISISIEFFQKEKYYIYEIEINDTEIQKEELYQSGIGNKENQLIYSRKGKDFTSINSVVEEVQTATNQLVKSNPMSSLLSLNNEFPIIQDERVKMVYKWFEEQVQVLSIYRVSPPIISAMSKNPKLLQFANGLFSNIGLGIESLDIKELKLTEIISDDSEESSRMKEDILNRLKGGNVAKLKNDRVLYAVETIKGEEIVKKFVFKQNGIDDFLGELEYEAQSDGTARILNLIPALYDMIDRQCIYFIDEIENSIHPTLMIAIMKFFSEIKTKGQLIFTTHETELLNQQELMRPDEVWFTEKRNGNTHLYSLNDFKLHNTINIKNGYLEGRYGAIPFIGSLGE